MQQGVPSGEVFEAAATVRVGALDVDASRVRVDRDMPDPLTSRGLRAASATINATVGHDVYQYVATPWDPSTWPPAPETPARVTLDMGEGGVQSLTGRVASVSGGTTSREVQVEIDDLYQTLDRPISWDELSAQSPDPAEGVEQRFPGLESVSITDLILRHCGWYCTPPGIGFTALSVPAMGSMWPETGTLVTCNGWDPSGSTSSVYPTWYVSAWGLVVSYVSASYNLAGAYTLAGRGHMELAAVNQHFPSTRNAMSLEARTSAGGGVRLTWSDSTAYVWWADSTGWTNTGVSVPRVDGLLYAQIDYLTNTSIRVTLENQDGATDTATVTVPTAVTTSPYTAGLIEGDEFGGGFQIAFPGTASAGSLSGWEPTALIHRSTSDSTHLQVRPPIAGANCADLLDEQCAAQAATYWIDEHGILQWWHLAELEKQANSATLTSTGQVNELSWSHDLSSVRARVIVEWTDLAVNHSAWSSVTLWEANDATMGDGETTEVFINVPDDEVWIQPDLNFTRIGDLAGGGGGTFEEFNRGRRSWWGGVLQESSTWAYPGAAGALTFRIERITGATFKGTMIRSGTEPAELRTPDATVSSSVSRNKRSMSLPVLRGKMRYTLVKQDYTATRRGPSTAPDLVIDGSWWLQSREQAKRTADYYAARCTAPEPVISNVDLVLVPGLQLGDIVTVVDESVSRLTILGVVTGDSKSVSSGSAPGHGIAIRPLQVSRNKVAWEEWGAFMNSELWQVWGADHADQKWTEWGRNPLDEQE